MRDFYVAHVIYVSYNVFGAVGEGTEERADVRTKEGTSCRRIEHLHR